MHPQALQMIEPLGNMYLALDLDANIIEASQPMLDLLEYKKEELLGQSITKIIPHFQHDEYKKNWLGFIEFSLSQDQKVKLSTKSDSNYSSVLLTSTSLNHQGDLAAVYCIFKNVVNLDIAGNYYWESQQKLQALINQAPFSIEMYDIYGNWLLGNKAWEKLWGLKPEDTYGVFNIFKDPQLIESGTVDLFKKAVLGEVVTVPDLSYDAYKAFGKGAKHWLSTSFYPIMDENDHPQNIVIVHKDITERKKAEMDLMKSTQSLHEEIASKNIFFSVLSHDLRGPLTGQKQMAELLLDQIEELSADEIKNLVKRIVDSSTRVYELLDKITEWSKVTSNKFSCRYSEFDLKQLVEATLELFKENALQKEISVSNSIAEETFLTSDPDMLHVILQNLLSNAIKFTQAKGKVIVRAKPDLGSNSEKIIKISVYDNGVGLDERKLSRLFNMDDCFSAKGTFGEKGSGLGLVLCKEFAEKINAEISVESSVGLGSVFTLSIPIKPSSLAGNSYVI